MQRRASGGAARLARAIAAAALGAAAFGACRPSGDRPLAIRDVEEHYQETRALRDEIEVTRSRDATETTRGVALGDVVERYAAARSELVRVLAAGAAPPLSPQDELALEVMRRTLAR